MYTIMGLTWAGHWCVGTSAAAMQDSGDYQEVMQEGIGRWRQIEGTWTKCSEAQAMCLRTKGGV